MTERTVGELRRILRANQEARKAVEAEHMIAVKQVEPVEGNVFRIITEAIYQ